jgi:hypothetical protein
MLKEKEIRLEGNNHKYTVDSIKNKNLASTATVIVLSRPYIARPIVINQNNSSLIHFRQINSPVTTDARHMIIWLMLQLASILRLKRR